MAPESRPADPDPRLRPPAAREAALRFHHALPDAALRPAGHVSAFVEGAWERLRAELGAARLEFRAAGGERLAAPRGFERRFDERWLAALPKGPGARLAPGRGLRPGQDAVTEARRDDGGLIVVQWVAPAAQAALPFEPYGSAAAGAERWLDDGELECLADAARAGLIRIAESRGYDDARRLARVGARAGGRLHDLRNQLTLALFHAERVAEAADLAAQRRAPSSDAPSTAPRAIDTLVAELRRARELAAEGLAPDDAAGAGEAGAGGPLEPRTMRRVPLRALIIEESRSLTLVARAGGARVLVRCPPDLVTLGDAIILGRLVRNLMLNAAESRAGGATVSVEARRVDACRLAVAITDDGRGMSEEVLAAYLAAGRTEGGTGFGTASITEALERLDAALCVTSAPGRGTRVELELWAAPPEGRAVVLAVEPGGEARDCAELGPSALRVTVPSPLRALALMDALAPLRIELHRAALGPGRRRLERAATRNAIPVEARSSR